MAPIPHAPSAGPAVVAGRRMPGPQYIIRATSSSTSSSNTSQGVRVHRKEKDECQKISWRRFPSLFCRVGQWRWEGTLVSLTFNIRGITCWQCATSPAKLELHASPRQDPVTPAPAVCNLPCGDQGGDAALGRQDPVTPSLEVCDLPCGDTKGDAAHRLNRIQPLLLPQCATSPAAVNVRRRVRPDRTRIQSLLP
jgi:hypothetical protein